MRGLLAGATVCILLGVVLLWLYEGGVIRFNAPDPERFPILGIDVSHHQGPVDWQALADAGVAFAFLKATEGRDFVDSRFETNWAASREAGIPRGAYHFFTFCSPGRAQAEHFLRVAAPAADALTPVADVEFVGNCKGYGDLAKVRRELEVFMDAVGRAWGRGPILYVTPDALERVVGDALAAHPIWIRSVFSEPAADAYRGWLLWQFSDNSRLPGIEGPVDRNALRSGASLRDLGAPAH